MDLSRCIDLCTESHRQCVQAAIHALAKGSPPVGAHPERDHIRLLWDCSDVCRTSADFMSRGSPFHHQTCRVCAAVCEACAEACLKADDPIMTRCAEVCRACATSCRELAAQ